VDQTPPAKLARQVDLSQGQTVRLSSALMQPIAADEVASVLTHVAFDELDDWLRTSAPPTFGLNITYPQFQAELNAAMRAFAPHRSRLSRTADDLAESSIRRFS